MTKKNKKNIIKVKNLSKTFKVHLKKAGILASIASLFKREYKEIKAVNKISFDVKEGEIIGFIGQNGAGKTTTLKMLSGLLFPTQGQVSVMGFDPWKRKKHFLKKISLIMGQKSQLWYDLAAIETFKLNKEIYEIPNKQFNQTLTELVDLLDAKDIINIQVRKLSLGQKMKCELIASMLHLPKIVFLDEPTIGLDVVMQKKLRNFIKQYNKKYNATIILTSHYMGDVADLCKKVIIINKGHLVYQGTLKKIFQKYAKNKILNLLFSEKINKKEITKYGKIKYYEHDKVKLTVKRNQASSTAAKILKKFEVLDLTIEEPPIEAIIRDFFKNN